MSVEDLEQRLALLAKHRVRVYEDAGLRILRDVTARDEREMELLK